MKGTQRIRPGQPSAGMRRGPVRASADGTRSSFSLGFGWKLARCPLETVLAGTMTSRGTWVPLRRGSVRRRMPHRGFAPP